MKKFNILLLFLFTLFYTQTQAQQRYVDQNVFADVTVTQNVVYGVNATVILLADTAVGEAIPQPLIMDIYQPAGDTVSNRPLVLLWHSGTFLPFPQNGQTNGTLRDSAVVDLATKLAKMGYVAASCDYRLGWNPIAPTQDERKIGIMNAAYRGIQDCRTAIRYHKFVAAEGNNVYGIDPNKIVIWGIGTAGYMAMGCASLDDYLEIASLPKFNVDVGGTPVPIVLEPVNGDIYGTSVGIVPPNYPPPFTPGDTLCYPNHVGYDSDFQLAVNMGGAVGDTTWVDENTISTVSFHVPTDPFAPYTTGLVLVPGFNLPVVIVSGSYDYQRMQQMYGNQEEWYDEEFLDDISAVADSRNDGLEGLMPMPTDSVENSAPWDWWDPNDMDLTSVHGQPDPVTGRASIDSILSYYAPRACLTLGLGCDLSGIVSLNEIEQAKIDLQISPNPAVDYVRFQSKEYPMEHIYVYDLNGRLVKVHTNIDSFDFEMRRNSLANGVYIAQVRFEHGAISKQIIFQR